MTKKKRSGNNTWQDHYTRQAKKEKYPARSVYKLEEIQSKFRILRPGQRVLDLGCAPGSWLLYAAKAVGASGLVVGVDLAPVTEALPGNARALTGDVFDADAEFWPAVGGAFDVVMSDMAPSTTGSAGVDAARSFQLCEAALAVARQRLSVGGCFVCKIFQGEDFQLMMSQVRDLFAVQKNFKPQSCRKASKEIYIVGINRKQEA